MMKQANMRPGFRSDINGLRAWAVAAVILYHFGVPGFGGGFVGVDIFFVISGFLMTGIVVNRLALGTFSLADFYMARAKRIVPALLVLCAVLLGLGWFILLPPDYKTLGVHSFYSLGFLSNIEFWKEAGYFDVASHEKWLLHTWSLSVEWQFYLLLPIVLWTTWRLRPGRRAQVGIVLACLAASLASSVVLSGSNPTAAFFLLHSRAWEMLAGGAVYLLANRRTMPAALRTWSATAGLLVIAASIAVFDKHAQWPGWRATLPVVGAMLVLAANHSSFWTGNKLAQWMGDRSYSLYLWHWPVFVSLVYAEGQHNTAALILALIAVFILGHLSYHLVEETTRASLGKLRLVQGAGLLIAGIVAVVGASVTIRAGHGLPARFSPVIENLAAEADNYNPRRIGCHVFSGVAWPSCEYGKGAGRIIALGDSHVSTITTALAQSLSSDNTAVIEWSYPACPFVPGLKKIGLATGASMQNDHCQEFLAWEAGQLETLPSTVPIVLIGRYAAAAFGKNEDGLDRPKPQVFFSTVAPITTPVFLQEFGQAVTASACQLAKRRTVYMMRPIPEMDVDVPKVMSRRLIFGKASEVSVSMASYRQRNDWLWAAQDAARDQCGIKILDPLPYLCHDGKCYGSRDGRPLYSDNNHLSEFGNKLLVPMFSQAFGRTQVAGK